MTDRPWSPDEPSSRRFPVLGVILTVLLITLTGLAILIWVTITLAYGAASILPMAFVLGVLPALLIAWSSRMIFVALLARPPAFVRTAVPAYIAIVLLAIVSVWVADRAYQEGVARAAEACSREEIAALRGVVLGDALAEEPSGGRDGSCRIVTPLPGGRQAVDAELGAAMRDAGFVEEENELGRRTFTRDALTMVAVVGVTDDKGLTDVTLSISG
jgi:hypothetical protein